MRGETEDGKMVEMVYRRGNRTDAITWQITSTLLAQGRCLQLNCQKQTRGSDRRQTSLHRRSRTKHGNAAQRLIPARISVCAEDDHTPDGHLRTEARSKFGASNNVPD